MFNLLPEEYKKALTKEYYFRALIIIFSLITLSIVIAISFIIPTYILSEARENVAEKEIEILKLEVGLREDGGKGQFLRNAKPLLELLSDRSKKQDFLYIINLVIKHKTKDIHLSDIKLTSANQTSVEISGVADNRTALINFRAGLELEGLFSGIELPVSNLAKSSDIKFDLKINNVLK